MQKFVIVKHAQKPKCMDNIFETQIRMSGYLKKKRNKIGGWRKLWFVLQNQLLLSYSSREDYEKKLVPFKDVLNLVPGSIVRPASGSRFTIETISNTIFTFRCGDSKTCADWIMALLESLSLNNPQSVIEKNLSFVMTNNNLFNVARSCESLVTSAHAASKKQQNSINIQSQAHHLITRSTPKLVRLPISSSNTKRLMQRGFIDDCNYIKLDRDRFPMSTSNYPIGVHNFRLHHTALKHNHSTEVSRINRMFQHKYTVAAACSTTGENNKLKHNFPIMNCIGGGDEVVNNVEENKMVLSQPQQRFILNEEHKYRENVLDDGQIYANIEEQIQYLTLDDETDCDLERSFSEGDILKFTKYKFQDDVVDKGIGGGDCDHGDDDKEMEVIYAVVNLKNKHARRAILQKPEERTERERLHSYAEANCNDYEEVNNISTELLQSYIDDNENIYEPIKGGKPTDDHTHQPKQTVWRYLPKIRFNFLLDSHGNQKNKDTASDPLNGPSSPCSSTSGTTSANSRTASSKDSSASSSFADMKRRWGNHRRSIKLKMKKLYGRSSNPNLSEINNDNNSNNNSSNSSNNNNLESSLFTTNQNKFGIKTRKEKHNFFGSLPRMKKYRTTPSIINMPTTVRTQSENTV